MALIKYGAVISEARGKEAGVIFSRNAYGAYLKQKVSPVNPNTSFQSAVRNRLAAIAQAYKDLNSAEKTEWTDFGAQQIRINRFGDQTAFTGFAAYIKCNQNLVNVGEDPITSPVAPISFPELELSFATLNDTTIELAFTPDPIGTGLKMVIDMTPSILGGKKFVKNLYRQIAVSAVNQGANLSLTTAYPAKFGALPVEGARVYCRARLVDVVSGWDTVHSFIEGTVVATP